MVVLKIVKETKTRKERLAVSLPPSNMTPVDVLCSLKSKIVKHGKKFKNAVRHKQYHRTLKKIYI